MVCVFDEPLTDVAVLLGDLEADLLGNTNARRRGMVGEGIGGRSGGEEAGGEAAAWKENALERENASGNERVR